MLLVLSIPSISTLIKWRPENWKNKKVWEEKKPFCTKPASSIFLFVSLSATQFLRVSEAVKWLELDVFMKLTKRTLFFHSVENNCGMGRANAFVEMPATCVPTYVCVYTYGQPYSTDNAPIFFSRSSNNIDHHAIVSQEGPYYPRRTFCFLLYVVTPVIFFSERCISGMLETLTTLGGVWLLSVTG